jgi:drug/metabolite transporter (DMT)-like permease
MRPADFAVPAIVSPAVPASPALRIPFPVLVGLFCLLWAGAFPAAKIAIADCPPLILLTLRFLSAGAIILGSAALVGRPWNLSRRDVIVFAVLGVANQAAYLGTGYVGMQTISSGLSALIVSCNPVLTAVLATAFLGERMTWRKAVGLLLGVGGVAFVVEHRIAVGSDHVVGIAFSIVSLISLVAGTFLYKWLAPKGDLWTGNGVQSLGAGFALLPFAFTFENAGDITPTWSLLAALAFMTLLVSVFAYLLWFHLLNTAGATAASSYHFLMPPLGMLFGWLLLGEHVTVADLSGIIPVALGIYLVTRAPPSSVMSEK